REIERRVGWGGGYISRILKGRIELKVSTLLEILAVLEVHPVPFFRLVFPLTPHSLESQATLRHIAASSPDLASPLPPDDHLKALIREPVLEMVREIVAAPT